MRAKNKSLSPILRTLATLLLAVLVGVAAAQSRTDARVVEQETQRGIVELYEALTPLRLLAVTVIILGVSILAVSARVT